MKKFLLGLVLLVTISTGGILMAQNTLDKDDGNSKMAVPRDKISNYKTGDDCKLPHGYCL